MAFRDNPLNDLRVPLTWTAAVVAVVAAVIAFALFAMDKRTPIGGPGYGAARSEFDEVIEPVTGVLAAPFRWLGEGGSFAGDYFFAVSENRRLKARVKALQRWEDAAIALKNLNLRYEALLKLRTEPPIPMVSARVVSDVRGPFTDARLADAGSNQGVKIGNPAMSEHGVAGRIVGVTLNASRILLLSDVESRTPVLIDRTNARAILTGDGGPNPRLEFVRGQNAIKDGDLILTSGDGGLYPRGLPVGVAARDYRGVWRARLYADRTSIDFVRVLVYDDFAQAVNEAQLAPGAPPPLSVAEQQQRQSMLDAAARPATPPPTAGLPAGAAAPPSAARPGPAVALNPPVRAPTPTLAPRPRPPAAAAPSPETALPARAHPRRPAVDETEPQVQAARPRRRSAPSEDGYRRVHTPTGEGVPYQEAYPNAPPQDGGA